MKVRLRIGSAALLLALLAAASLHAAIEVPLTYVPYPVTRAAGSFLPWQTRGFETLLTVPPGEWKLPELKSKNPAYVLLKLGDTERLAIYDRINSEDQFYTRLYLDMNANGDLTDDAPMDKPAGPSSRPYFQVGFPQVDLTYQVGGKTLPNRIALSAAFYFMSPDASQRFSPENLKQHLRLNCSIQACYEGSFALDGATWYCYLSDGTGNGLYNDGPEVPENFRQNMMTDYPVFFSSDNLFLRKDKNFSGYEGINFSPRLLIKNTLYEVVVDLPAGKMILTPRTENLVPVQLPMETEKLALYDEQTKQSVSLIIPESRVNIPAGNYIAAGYTVYRKEENNGPNWRIGARCSSRSQPVAVNNSAPVVLKYGEPYNASVSIPPWVRENFGRGMSQVNLSLLLQGAGNEIISDLACLSGEGVSPSRLPLSARNRTRPQEASFTISGPDGKIVKQGTFEYG